MILRHVWQTPVADLSVFVWGFIGIENPGEIPRPQGGVSQEKQTSDVPQESKLETFLGFLSLEVGGVLNRNSKSMTEKGRLLVRQPEDTVKVLLHWPYTLTSQFESGGIKGPIRSQLRVLLHIAQTRINMELKTVSSKVTINDLWACFEKVFNLEQLSAELRAGSTGAQRKRFPGVTTRSERSPKPIEHKQLLS